MIIWFEYTIRECRVAQSQIWTLNRSLEHCIHVVLEECKTNAFPFIWHWRNVKGNAFPWKWYCRNVKGMFSDIEGMYKKCFPLHLVFFPMHFHLLEECQRKCFPGYVVLEDCKRNIFPCVWYWRNVKEMLSHVCGIGGMWTKWNNYFLLLLLYYTK